jgi:hypothetical protein
MEAGQVEHLNTLLTFSPTSQFLRGLRTWRVDNSLYYEVGPFLEVLSPTLPGESYVAFHSLIQIKNSTHSEGLNLKVQNVSHVHFALELDQLRVSLADTFF